MRWAMEDLWTPHTVDTGCSLGSLKEHIDKSSKTSEQVNCDFLLDSKIIKTWTTVEMLKRIKVI